MSNESDLEDWLENSITNEYFNYYKYSDLKDTIQLIGEGNFGKVFRANWKNSDRFFALKAFNEDKITIKEFVKEVM